MTITIYGIKNCDTIKKTRKRLDTLGASYDFFDYKKQDIDKDSIVRWVDGLGLDKVLNKRGTTWRKLSDEQKQAADSDTDAGTDAAIELLLANPSMIKRPIIEGDSHGQTVLLCGFDEADIERVFG